jgi:hypothetical protein
MDFSRLAKQLPQLRGSQKISQAAVARDPKLGSWGEPTVGSWKERFTTECPAHALKHGMEEASWSKRFVLERQRLQCRGGQQAGVADSVKHPHEELGGIFDNLCVDRRILVE